MLIAVTSRKLAPEKCFDHDFVVVYNDSNISEQEFRGSIGYISMCDYFAIDRRNRWAGIYIGFCLSHNIEFIEVGIPKGTYYGAYASLSRSEWRGFLAKLSEPGTSTEISSTSYDTSGLRPGWPVGALSR